MRSYLKEIREQLGLSQQDVAEKLGISLSYYSLIESGNRQKSMELITAQKISMVLNISIESIISEELKLSLKTA